MSLGVPRVASMTISFARPLFRLVTTRMYIYRWLAGYLILRVGFGFAAGSQPKRPGDPSEPSARRLRVASRARGPRAARPNPGRYNLPAHAPRRTPPWWLARRPRSSLARGKASRHAADEKWIKPSYEQINEKWSPAKQVVTQS